MMSMAESSIGAPATTSTSAIGSTSATFALVITLFLRACVNAAFSVWLFTRAPLWLDIFWAGAIYALADGALGLMVVFLLVRHKPFGATPQLVAMILADAVLRCAVGIATLTLPGIPDFPITLVLFYGVLGAWAASAGVIAMIAWFVAHKHQKHARRRSRSPAHVLFDPLEGAGLLAFLLAVYALAVGPPATAETLCIAAAAASGALALVFLVAALGVAVSPTQRAEA